MLRFLKLRRVLLVLLGVSLAVVVFDLGARRFYVVRDALQPADCIFVLNHPYPGRAITAASLYHQKLAPRLVIAQVRVGTHDTTQWARIIWRLWEVPDSAVSVVPFPGGVTSTMDEARAFASVARSAHFRRVIVVTDAYHTRRARWALRTATDGLRIRFLMAPVPDVARGMAVLKVRAWEFEDFLEEIGKLAGYIVLYG
jgi:uncharacterized SAM-binding protein YcdF (DUF218 family)